ncbi:MAG: Stk1 family PASTA domain-containing Ser/Thr kinase [Actinomycetes bacterium]
MTDAQRLGDRYELGDVLGRGGMAEVHLGRDVRLGRTVAIKTLRADLARDPTFQARFRREAQSAASLNHPSIVAVYDTGEDLVHGVFLPFIVMEYVEGQTLRDLMIDGRRLLPDRALEVTAGVLRALEYSHRAGIIHRDIKPANVMLSQNGDIKVMDFGIARAVADTSSSMTQTAAVIGTAQYLSPEQARGATVDARSDLYSTGCLLYELLTGRPPFTGDSPVAVAYQHVREDPIPPSHLDPDIPEAVDAIVMKSLAKNPENRYQDAGEMRADIERALAGQPVAAPAVFGDEATQMMSQTTAMPQVAEEEEPRRRRTWAWVLLALAVIAVFVLAALLGRQLFGDSVKDVSVPDVGGLRRAAAEERLREAGLELGEVRREFSTRPAGRVIEQRPAADATVDTGSQVDLVVSRGSKQVTVPDIQGESREDAAQALDDAGLAVGDVRPEDSAEEADTVLSSSPGQGSTVDRGSEVDLTVASGQNEVPDVSGQPGSVARSTLRDAGFRVSTSSTQTDDASPGTVVTQSPGAGESLPLGSTVSITLAEAPPEPAPTVTETVPPPEPTPSETETFPFPDDG